MQINHRALKNRMKTMDLNVYRLSAMSKVHYSTVRHIFKKKTKTPKIDTVMRIAKALDMNINDLLSMG